MGVERPLPDPPDVRKLPERRHSSRFARNAGPSSVSKRSTNDSRASTIERDPCDVDVDLLATQACVPPRTPRRVVSDGLEHCSPDPITGFACGLARARRRGWSSQFDGANGTHLAQVIHSSGRRRVGLEPRAPSTRPSRRCHGSADYLVDVGRRPRAQRRTSRTRLYLQAFEALSTSRARLPARPRRMPSSLPEFPADIPTSFSLPRARTDLLPDRRDDSDRPVTASVMTTHWITAPMWG